MNTNESPSDERPALTPIVQRLLGVAVGSRGLEAYRRYLREKYGR